MSKTTILILALVAVVLLCDFVDARCDRSHRRKCCRDRYDVGTCHNFGTRYFYNTSCGRCQPFRYSGCGGFENNFLDFEECDGCCRGVTPCASYSLHRPPFGCNYRWLDGLDECPRPRLECNNCERRRCAVDSCRFGERCVPFRGHCNRCPCNEFKCLTDPCHSIGRRLGPCERCIGVPRRHCNIEPCPFEPFIENFCESGFPRLPFFPLERLERFERFEERRFFPLERELLGPVGEFFPGRHHHHHCPFRRFECPLRGDACSRFPRCFVEPRARCFNDPCDCRRAFWRFEERLWSNEECFLERRW